jgi:hypothetical protein
LARHKGWPGRTWRYVTVYHQDKKALRAFKVLLIVAQYKLLILPFIIFV